MRSPVLHRERRRVLSDALGEEYVGADSRLDPGDTPGFVRGDSGTYHADPRCPRLQSGSKYVRAHPLSFCRRAVYLERCNYCTADNGGAGR